MATEHDYRDALLDAYDMEDENYDKYAEEEDLIDFEEEGRFEGGAESKRQLVYKAAGASSTPDEARSDVGSGLRDDRTRPDISLTQEMQQAWQSPGQESIDVDAPPLDPYGYLMERPPDGAPSLPMIIPGTGEMLFLEVDAEGALRRSEGLSTGGGTPSGAGADPSDAGRYRYNRDAAPMLGESMSTLLSQVEASRRADAREQARAEAAARKAALKGGAGSAAQAAPLMASGAASAALARSMTKVQAAKARRSAQKWTDRYQPSHFMQLLTAEHINRSMLQWVHLWDKTVFGSDRRKRHATSGGPDQTQEEKRTQSFFGGGSAGGGAGASAGAGAGAGANPGATQASEEKAYYSQVWPRGWRRDARIVLLAGPAGVGKTVLAHIVAKHCGYELLELNASDDRTVTTLRPRLEAAMQIRSVSAKGDRPRLVLLDEIDGLDASAVDYLVKVIERTPAPGVPKRHGTSGEDEEKGKGRGRKRGKGNNKATEGDAEDDTKKKKKRRGPTATVLTRPVICTCNDLYAPVLRRLREHAQVVECERPSSSRLLGLLKRICSQEGIFATHDGLQAVMARCGNDIRGCINTLQTIGQRARSTGNARSGTFRLTADIVEQLPVGARDDTKSAFDVWNSVFRGDGKLPGQGRSLGGGLASRALGAGGQGTAAFMTPRKGHSAGGGHIAPLLFQPRERALLDILSSQSVDGSLLLDGLRANYPRMSYQDPTMQHTSEAAMWFAYGDVGLCRAKTRQAYQLLHSAYVSAMGVHSACKPDGTAAMRCRWPKEERRVRFDRVAREDLARSFMLGRGKAAVAVAAASHMKERARVRHGLRSRDASTQAGLGLLQLKTSVLDIVPQVVTIANPQIRPVSLGLFNSRETRDMERLRDVLLSTGLNYHRVQGDRGSDGGAVPRPLDEQNGGSGTGVFGALDGSGSGKRARARAGDDDGHFELSPDLLQLLDYRGQSSFDSESGRKPTLGVVREVVAQQVRREFVRVRARAAEAKRLADGDIAGGMDEEGEELALEALGFGAESGDAGGAQGGAGKGGYGGFAPGAAQGKRRRVELPAHVRTLMEHARRQRNISEGRPVDGLPPTPTSGSQSQSQSQSQLLEASDGGSNNGPRATSMADFLAGGIRSGTAAPAGGNGRRRKTVQEQAIAKLHATGQLAAVATGGPAGRDASKCSPGDDAWWASTQTDVLFTYLEGFSNAVRRPVGIADLM